MAKQRWKRTLSLILSAAMIWGMSGMPAFAEEPASPAPVPEVESEVPLVTDPQPETKTCTCTAPCAEGSVNTGCPVCSAEGADLSACKGESPDACTCTVPCTEDSTNAECPVCSKDWNACAPKTEVPTENEETKAFIEKLPSLEEYHQWRPTLEPPPEDEGYQAAYDAAVAAHRKEVEEQVKVARAAYDSMTEEQKAAFDPALTAKLTTWETKLSQPVTNMEGRLSSLPSVEEFQNWKPTRTIPETDPSYQAAYDEAVAAHRKEVEDQVNAVREAYDALSEAARAVLDPALVEKLTTLEGILTPVMAAYAKNGGTYNIGYEDVNLGSEGGKVTITGTSDSKWEYKAQHHITVEGGTWTITLQDCKIKTPGSSNSAFDIKNGAHVTLVLAGNNEMYGGGGGSHPAIWVESGSTLTIAGDGSLLAQAKGGSGAAGIGAGDGQDFGDIIINDGTVTALGSGGGAGIGGGYKIFGSVSGNVTINGGWVKAYGGHVESFSAGAGIGAGENTSYGGTITINGGVVYAKGGGNNAVSIGGGGYIGGKVSHGTFSTGANGDAVIIAPDGIGDKSGHASWQAIFCGHGGADSASLSNGSVSLKNNTFQVLGEVTPGYSLNVGSNVVLNINANGNHRPAKLIMNGHNLINNGTVNVGNGNDDDDSVLELHNHKACGGKGKLSVSNNGKLQVDLTEDMITLDPNSFVYSGQACKPKVTVKLYQWGYAKTYVRSTDYTVNYTGNTNVGTATAEVTPISGGLLLGSGAVIKNFTITAGDYTVTVPTEWSIMEGCNDLLSHLPTHKTNPANITGKLEWFSDIGRAKLLTNDFVQNEKSGETVPVYWKFTPDDNTNYPISETGTTTLQIVAYQVHEASIWNDKNKNITEQDIQKAYGEGPFNVNAKINTGSNGAPVAPKSQVTWTSSNSDVATVARNSGTFDEQAKVTIKGVGTTTITATIAKYVEYKSSGQPDIANSYSEVQATFTLKVTEKEIYVDTVIATNRPYSGRPGSSSGGSSTYDPQAKDPDRVQVSLEARKLLDGKTPGKQEFTFTLTDEKGKVVRTAENKGGKIVFDSLALLPGTYRYTMEEVNGSGGSAFGYDDTVYEAEIFVYTSGGKYTAMVSYYQDGKELDELPTFRNTTAPAAPGTDKENPITGGGPAFPAALTAMVSLGAIAFLWRKRS